MVDCQAFVRIAPPPITNEPSSTVDMRASRLAVRLGSPLRPVLDLGVLSFAGGPIAAHAMIKRAHDLGLKVMLGCRAAETSVAIAAAAHLAPSVEWADLDGNLLIVDDPFHAVPVKDGRFVFSERPGLGVVPA